MGATARATAILSLGIHDLTITTLIRKVAANGERRITGPTPVIPDVDAVGSIVVDAGLRGVVEARTEVDAGVARAVGLPRPRRPRVLRPTVMVVTRLARPIEAARIVGVVRAIPILGPTRLIGVGATPVGEARPRIVGRTVVVVLDVRPSHVP